MRESRLLLLFLFILSVGFSPKAYVAIKDPDGTWQRTAPDSCGESGTEMTVSSGGSQCSNLGYPTNTGDTTNCEWYYDYNACQDGTWTFYTYVYWWPNINSQEDCDALNEDCTWKKCDGSFYCVCKSVGSTTTSIDLDQDSNSCTNCNYHWEDDFESGLDDPDCCGDDSGENYRTTQEYESNNAIEDSSDDTACCNSATDCVYSGTCYGSTVCITGSSSKYYCVSGKWTTNGDLSESACNCIVGSGRWNLGGDAADASKCCGNDASGEYYKTCAEYESNNACEDSSDDIACCDSSTDCVYSNTCYPSGSGCVDNEYFCTGGKWTTNGDLSESACNCIVGSGRWNLGGDAADASKCCGNDASGEYYKTCSASSDPGNDACEQSSDDIACCDSGTDCVYNDGCNASGTFQDVDNDGFKEYCDDGTWKKAPNDVSGCTYGEECQSGLCVNGYCRSDCNGYDIRGASNDDSHAYSSYYHVCADYNDQNLVETLLPGLYAPISPYMIDEGNTINSNGWFDYSDNPNIYGKIYTKTGDSVTVSGATFYCRGPNGENEDTGGTSYTASGSSGTYYRPSNFGSGYGQYSCWPGANDDSGYDCCYEIGSSGPQSSTERKVYFNADDIDLSCSISCIYESSTPKLNVSFTASHKNSGNSNSIEKKGCYGSSSCETASTNTCGLTTDDYCTISVTTTQGTAVYAYARDSSYHWIDTDTSVSCGNIPDADTSQCWCELSEKTYFSSYSAGNGANCCGDDGSSDMFENSGTGNSCCILGGVVSSNNTSSQDTSYLCYNGEIYYCKGTGSADSYDFTTDSAPCARVGDWYCDDDGNWYHQIARGNTPADCDGSSEDPYGEEHTTSYDAETCQSNAMIYDWGNGVSNQNKGWRCDETWIGPYAAECKLTQSGSTITVRVVVADEVAQNYASGGYVLRVGDYDTVSDTANYDDSGYPGTLIWNPSASSYSGIDSNEETYGDYFDVSVDYSNLDVKFTEEKTYYAEVGLEELSGSDCSTRTCDTEDPNNNEGSAVCSATLCVPVGYSASSDNDCCPVGSNAGEYPGKDNTDGKCVRCNTSTHTQLAGATGNGKCEYKCGASSQCDEESPGTCLSQGQCGSSDCQYYDYDSSQSACENCGYRWTGSKCCGDDDPSSPDDNYIDSANSNFLCYEGHVYSCNSQSTYSFDTDMMTCAKVGDYYCTGTGWDTSSSGLGEESCRSICEESGVWFGGESTEACCSSDDEFVAEYVPLDRLALDLGFNWGTSYTNDTSGGIYGRMVDNATIDLSDKVEGTGSLSLDGDGDYVEVGDSPQLRLAGNLTIAVWVKPTNISKGRQTIIFKSYNYEYELVMEYSPAGKLSFYHGDGAWEKIDEPNEWSVTENEWNFVAVTRDVSTKTIRFYINGKYVGSDDFTKTPASSTNDVIIGNRPGNSFYFEGNIDKLMLFNRTLSSDEIAVLYREFSENRQQDLVLYFPFDDASTSSVPDSSKYNNDGTPHSVSIIDEGKSSKGAQFTSGSYIDVSDSGSEWDFSSFTAMAWINPSDKSGTHGIMGEGAKWRLSLINGNLTLWIKGGSNTDTLYYAYPYGTGEWHHVAASYDGTMRLYIDGVEVASKSSSVTMDSSGDSNQAVGTEYVGSSYSFAGVLDEVRIYSRALRASEIMYLSNLERWNKYACKSGEKQACEGTSCLNASEEGVNYYCSNNSYTAYYYSVDTCQNACETYGGTWAGKGADKNCCTRIQNTETWCNSTETACVGGVFYNCSYWCDLYGRVGDYACTQDKDHDCYSKGCSDSATPVCQCVKGTEISCTSDSECNSGNCVSYSYDVVPDQIGYMNETTPGDSVCCDEGDCAYDSDGDGKVDSCASNTSYSIDADRDGDLDYCLNGVWYECDNYVAENHLASDCSCAGPDIAVNKSGTWVCRKQPVDFLYDTDVSCGTACDSDSNPETSERINANGVCLQLDMSCGTFWKDYGWTGNDTLVNVYVNATCPCLENAQCTATIRNANGVESTASFEVPPGERRSVTLDPNARYGTNNVTVSCSCPSSSITCTKTLQPIVVKESSRVITPVCKVGNCEINVNSTNLGSIPLNFTVTVNPSNGTSTLTAINSTYVQAMSYRLITTNHSIPESWLKPTWETGTNYTSFSISATVNLSKVSHETTVTGGGKLVQCFSTGDCASLCGSTDVCWPSSETNWICTSNVCCRQNEKFENGACCPTSEQCCLTDSNCGEDEWCYNYSLANGYYCQQKKVLGSSCNQSRECLSNWCGGKCADPTQVSLDSWYECSPYQDTYCQYQEITTSEGTGPKGCSSDTDCGEGYYCYLPKAVCLKCPTASSTYGTLNISNDELCPSLSCVGYDLDCCVSDDDCSSGAWCSAVSSCTSCESVKDYICPSTNCIGTDPDCCSTDSDCSGGEKCDHNVCVGNMGTSCTTSSDCTGNLQCISGVCANPDFVSVTPEQVSAKVGDIVRLTLMVGNPVNKEVSARVSVTGEDAALVTVDGSRNKEITILPGEAHKMLVTVYAGKSGTLDFTIKVNVPEYSLTATCNKDDPNCKIQIDVSAERAEGVPSAPVDAWLAVMILGAVIGMITLR